MSAISTKELPVSGQIALSIVTGLLIGGIISLGFPLDWYTAAIVVTGMVAVLLIMQRDAKRVFLFIIALVIPFYIGSTLPALYTKSGHVGLSQSFDIQFLDILLLSLMMSRIARWAIHQTDIRIYPYITVPALVWIIASALSVVNAREVDLTLMAVAEMVRLLLFYIIIANSIEDVTDLKLLVLALILGVSFQGLLGLSQWIVGGPIGFAFLGEPAHLISGGRIMGTIGHPNGYGMYIASTIPLALTLLFLEVRSIYKVLIGVVLTLSVLGLLFSQSRGAWVAFLVVTIVILVFAFYRKRFNSRVFFVGAGILFLIFLSLIFSQRDLITTRFTDKQAVASAESRATLNAGAIAMIKDYPILGVGLNNYSLFMPNYNPIDFKRANRVIIVHNIYLLIAAETGLVGLVAFLWFITSLFVQAGRLASRAPNDTVWLVGVGAFSAYTALTVHGMVDYAMLASSPLFRLLWLFAAIVASMSEGTRYDGVISKQSFPIA